MKYPCKTCKAKTGKARDYCNGCLAWREWFRAAWPRVCKRILRRGKGGRR